MGYKEGGTALTVELVNPITTI